MHIQYKSQSTSMYEYGCDLRRLFPWKEVAAPSWGGGIASVRPGEATTPHSRHLKRQETVLLQQLESEVRAGG